MLSFGVVLDACVLIIVTSNLRRFPRRALEQWGIEAQSPDTFPSHLFDLEAAPMVRVVEQQQAALHNPPMDIEQVLGKLESAVPQFVQSIRAYRSGIAATEGLLPNDKEAP